MTCYAYVITHSIVILLIVCWCLWALNLLLMDIVHHQGLVSRFVGEISLLGIVVVGEDGEGIFAVDHMLKVTMNNT